MPSPVRRRVRRARPPLELVSRLAARGIHALDAAGPEGWRTSPGGTGPGASLLACEPEVVFEGGVEALHDARRWLWDWRGPEPLAALLAGYLSYDLGRAFERIPARIAAEPPDDAAPLRLAAFRAVYRYQRNGSGEVVGSDAAAVAELADRIEGACASADPIRGPSLPEPVPRTSDPDYRAGIRRIQDWIRAGDVYQVNLSRRLDLAPVPRAGLPSLYECLAARSRAPFSAYLDAGDLTLLSTSPERFLRVEGRRVETCPIKGTRPRSRSLEHDRLLAKELETSAKDRAEHVMIVDLERNDLGRVCHTGTVRVARLAALRSFANVHHLVSSVQGDLRDPGDWSGLLAATFPGGSITGAPKLRAMEIIETLEPVRRGVYTGAIGCFDAAGGIDLSIAIRTALARDDRLYLHLGGGIVADSEPEEELAETRDKGGVFSALWGAAR